MEMPLPANDLIFQESDSNSSGDEQIGIPTNNISKIQSIHEPMRKSKSHALIKQKDKTRYDHHIADAAELQPNILLKRNSQSGHIKKETPKKLQLLEVPQGIDEIKSRARLGSQRRKKTNQSSVRQISVKEASVREASVSEKLEDSESIEQNNSSLKMNMQLKHEKYEIELVSDSFSDLSPDKFNDKPTKMSFHKFQNHVIQSFKLIRSKTCGINFCHPDYIITSMSDHILLNAKKQWCHLNSHYKIWEDNMEMGQLRGNFGGTEFELFERREQDLRLVAVIRYRVECGCCNSVRKMQVFLRTGSIDENLSLEQNYQRGEGVIRLVNKEPVWDQRHGAFVLRFKGKRPIASTKNIILIKEGENEQKMMFCKIGGDEFHLQGVNPLSAFICFGIVLTSFDFKLFLQ